MGYNINIENISGTSKVTISEWVFSPEISLKIVTTLVCVTVTKSATENRGKEQMTEPAQMEEPK